MRRASPVTSGFVLTPATRPFAHALPALLELDDPVDGAVEELAVVRDDDHAATHALDEALEPGEAVEVEVVGRLVEAVDLVAREQQRCQAGPRRLSARGRIERPLGTERTWVSVKSGAAERRFSTTVRLRSSVSCSCA